MNRSDHTLECLEPRRRARALIRPLFRLLFLLWLAALITCGSRAAEAHNATASSVRSPLAFAVADFDGDLRPDLAHIQIGRSDAALTDYWVQLQLSGAGQQSILVVAPSGGLQISVRDVNGDDAPDLVLTTSWLKTPVAILLNDGRGGFSRKEPSAFPYAFTESKSTWGSSADQPLDVSAGLPQSRAGICSATVRLPHLRAPVALVLPSSHGIVLHTCLLSHDGRAPPR